MSDPVKKQPSNLMWVIAVLLVALGVALWFYLKPVDPVNLPANKDVGKIVAKEGGAGMTETVTNFFTSATETFNGIKDAATAEAALPKLKEFSTQADELKKGYGLLPDAGKVAVKTMLGTGIEKLKAIVEKLMAMPGVGEKLKPIVEPLMAKLAAITG